MRFAPIVPIPILEYIQKADYHLVLASKCYMGQYRRFYQAVDGFTILDNGAAEGQLMGDDALLHLAAELDVDEVVAPDRMHDAYETAFLLRNFCHRSPNINVMAVLQATSWAEFQYVLETALECEVVSLALPKLLTKHLGPLARLAAAEVVRDFTSLPIHCLGCPRRLTEAKDLARQGIVRGIDSSAPVVLGLQGRGIRHVQYDWETSHSAIPNFWSARLTEQVEVNLDEFREWCESPPSIGEVRRVQPQ